MINRPYDLMTRLVRLPAWLLQPAARRKQLAGWIIAAAFVLGIAGTLTASPSMAWAAAGYWIAAVLCASVQRLRRTGLSIVLAAIGVAVIMLSTHRGAHFSLPQALSANSQLISMLVAATLLAMFGGQAASGGESLPVGRAAILKTLLASHLLGSVLNLGAVYLLGDRMAERKPMDERQAIVLTRGFASAGFWSPFFITMAVALNYAPGANLLILLSTGVAMAAVALLLTHVEVARMGPPRSFAGYPVSLSALRLPIGMISGVICIHLAWPKYSALNAIAFLTAALALLLAILRPAEWAGKLVDAIRHRLPELASEIVLFISAGIFSMGFVLLLGTLPAWRPFDEFGFAAATACFLAIVLLAQVGVHPIASISFIGPLASALAPPPTLVACVLLYAWALSSAVSPLSSQNLGTFTRYRIDGRGIHFRNLRYAAFMSVFMIATFFLHRGSTA